MLVTARRRTPRAGTIVDLHAVQTATHPELGIARSVADLARSLEALEPGAVRAYSYCPELRTGPLRSLVGADRLVRATEQHRYAPSVIHHLGLRGHEPRSVPAAERAVDGCGAGGDPAGPHPPCRTPDDYLTDPCCAAGTSRGPARPVRRHGALHLRAQSQRCDRPPRPPARPGRRDRAGAVGTLRPARAPRRPVGMPAVTVDVRPGFVLFPGGTDPRKNLHPSCGRTTSSIRLSAAATSSWWRAGSEPTSRPGSTGGWPTSASATTSSSRGSSTTTCSSRCTRWRTSWCSRRPTRATGCR